MGIFDYIDNPTPAEIVDELLNPKKGSWLTEGLAWMESAIQKMEDYNNGT